MKAKTPNNAITSIQHAMQRGREDRRRKLHAGLVPYKDAELQEAYERGYRFEWDIEKRRAGR